MVSLRLFGIAILIPMTLVSRVLILLISCSQLWWSRALYLLSCGLILSLVFRAMGLFLILRLFLIGYLWCPLSKLLCPVSSSFSWVICLLKDRTVPVAMLVVTGVEIGAITVQLQMRTLQVFHSSSYRRGLFLRGLVVVIGALITSRALTLLK
jgi:hypothetical protein